MFRHIPKVTEFSRKFLHTKKHVYRNDKLNTIVIGIGTVTAGVGGYLLWVRGKNLRSPCSLHAESVNSLEPIAPHALNDNAKRKILADAIAHSRELLERKKEEAGVPGIAVAVNVDGQTLWSEGLGYADVENRVPCGRETMMRIGSISKPIAMAAVAKLWEEGKLNLDKPIQEYVPSFPQKTYEGKPVELTVRQLVSHLGGIRHYKTKPGDVEPANKNSDTESLEFFLYRKFKTVEEALELFKDDPLLSKPGTKYFYTTFGWTLISAAVEGASKETFPVYLNKVLRSIGMNSTVLDENDPIIYHRTRFYTRNAKGGLLNSRCVDSSYKWAGGGLLSNVGDLVLFGSAMLYCFQAGPNDRQGFLQPSTVQELWTPMESTTGKFSRNGRYSSYGMGWRLSDKQDACGGCANKRPFAAYHSGGSVGGTSALVVVPTVKHRGKGSPPHGVVVAILGNINDVAYEEVAFDIAKEFSKLSN